MAISQAEAKRAVQAAVDFWGQRLDVEKLRIDDLPKEAMAPIILSHTHDDPVTGTVIQVGGILFLSENIEGTKGMLANLATSRFGLAAEQEQSP